MTKFEKQIEDLVWSLAEGEREKNFHRWASIIPWRNKKRNSQQLMLDALSRLLTGRETCVAVFINSEEHLLIASNVEEPRHAKYYIKDLREYVNCPEKEENYIKLVEYALADICQEVQKEDTFEIMKGRGGLFLFKQYFIGGFNELTKDEWDKVQKLAKSAFEEVKGNKKSLVEWDKYLCPLYDTYTIAEFFGSGKEFSSTGWDLYETIKENKIEYWQSGSKWRENMHAEMKILTMLNFKGTLEKEKGYVGISKLCCVPCQLMFNVVNSKKQEREYDFITCGTHGGTYYSWVVPEFYQKDLVKEIEDLRTKARESTSEMPEKMYLARQEYMPHN